MIENVVTASEVPPPPLAEENEGGSEVMKKFFTLNENFRGKIKDSLLQNEISRVSRISIRIMLVKARVPYFLHDYLASPNLSEDVCD
jgi:hypothetical protein